MNKFTTQSEAKRSLAAQQTHHDLNPGDGVIKMPTHDDIAKRAYDLYVCSGYKKGRCEMNWQQAEYDLRDHGVNNRTIQAIRGTDHDTVGLAAARR